MIGNVKKSFYALIIGLLIAFLVFSMLLYTSTVQRVSLEQMNQSTEELAIQICSSFELVIEQIRDQVNKLGIYDNQLTRLIKTRKQSAAKSMELYDAIQSIEMGNQYIYSTYLYIKEENIFLDSNRGYSFSYEEFPDHAILEAIKSKHFTTVPPHVMTDGTMKQVLLFSIIIPLSHPYEDNNQDILSVNIDLKQLYHDILKRNSNINDLKLFVYNEKQEIILSDNIDDLYHNMKEKEKETLPQATSFFSILSEKEGIMKATTWSKDLDWYFQIQLPYMIRANLLKNEYFFVAVFLLIIIVILIGSYILLGVITKPIHAILSDYNDKLLREILLNSAAIEKEGELEELLKTFPYNKYLVLLIELAGNKEDITIDIVNQVLKQIGGKDKFLSHSVQTDSGCIAIVCNYEQNSDWEKWWNNWLKAFYQKLNNFFVGQVYVAVSNPKNSFDGLPVAYGECEEIQACKLSLIEHIFTQEKFRKLQTSVTYPVELEKQLINNLLVGNLEGCLFYADKFLDHLFKNEGLLPDIMVKNYLYQLQNEILKRISSLPISIKFSNRFDLLNEGYNKEQIQELFLELLHSLCQEIEKKDIHNKSLLHEAIIEYINAHLTEDNFNLNTLSYQFNLNRNYLAKLIKDKTCYTFNDYVNLKKIEIAKDLLNNTDMTVDEIAHRTGFNYTHYFIKTFKNLEGITPGQYRKIKE